MKELTRDQLVDWLDEHGTVYVKFIDPRGNAEGEVLYRPFLPDFENEFLQPESISAIWSDGDEEDATIKLERRNGNRIFFYSTVVELWMYPLDSDFEIDEAISAGQCHEYYVFDKLQTEGSDRVDSQSEYEAFVDSDQMINGTTSWALIEEILAYDGRVDRTVLAVSVPPSKPEAESV